MNAAAGRLFSTPTPSSATTFDQCRLTSHPIEKNDYESLGSGLSTMMIFVQALLLKITCECVRGRFVGSELSLGTILN